MSSEPGLLTAAMRRVRPAVLLPLIGGNLLLGVAGMFALWIPDSHGWQLLLSFLLVLGLASGFLLWNATAMRRLRTASVATPLWKGALLLGACVLLAAVLFYMAGLVEPNIETRAGYWNSQMPSHMRQLLPYTRLISMQEMAVVVFRWVLVPGLLLPFAMETAATGLHAGSMRRAGRVLLSLRHWIIAVVVLGLAAWMVPVIAAWHPSHTVHGEVVSAVLRLSFAGLLALAAVLLLLAAEAELLHRRETAGASEAK